MCDNPEVHRFNLCAKTGVGMEVEIVLVFNMQENSFLFWKVATAKPTGPLPGSEGEFM